MALLVGDIGGTKTRMGVYSLDKGKAVLLIEKTFASAQYPNFESILALFLRQVDMKFEKAVLGVAGPVVDDRVSITNLPWKIDKKKLEDRFEIPLVKLLNDLETMGYAVLALDSTDLFTLNGGRADPQGNIAVIAPGTGLGEAFLTRVSSRYIPSATEGGHGDFAPTNSLQIRLLQYLSNRLGHVSYERVCSGLGIKNIYGFLKQGEQMEEPEWLAQALLKVKDPVPVIIDSALSKDRQCKICMATLDLFLSILGAEAGNLALKVKATGGVYLGGGILPRIISVLDNGILIGAFKKKQAMAGLLERIPVHVILNPDAALLGAARYGFNGLGSNFAHLS